MRKLNNKGFSLVEILTALAIGSIVLLGVAAFMNGGSVSYKTATTQVALQDEVQESLNYINDLLQKSMDVCFDDSNDILYCFMPKTDSTTGDYEIYYVFYAESRQKLYVKRETVGDNPGEVPYGLGLRMMDKSAHYDENWLLASEMTHFNVEVERTPNTATPAPDGSPVLSKGAYEPSIIHVEVGFVKNGSPREASISVRPRNRSWTYDPTKDRFFNVLGLPS